MTPHDFLTASQEGSGCVTCVTCVTRGEKANYDNGLRCDANSNLCVTLRHALRHASSLASRFVTCVTLASRLTH
jgi:hypothetical protein